MIRLKVSPQSARLRLYTVDYRSFREASPTNWRVNADGTVPEQTVCWLFCSAMAGMNGVSATKAAERVFREVFDVPFGVFRAHVPHEWSSSR